MILLTFVNFIKAYTTPFNKSICTNVDWIYKYYMKKSLIGIAWSSVVYLDLI